MSLICIYLQFILPEALQSHGAVLSGLNLHDQVYSNKIVKFQKYILLYTKTTTEYLANIS
jgi:hypothetical protein